MSRPAVVMLSGIRWDFLWQRHQTLATHFARAGYPTVFVETTGLSNIRVNRKTPRKVVVRISHSRGSRATNEPRLTVYAPLVVPPTHGAFRRINHEFLVPRVARDLKKLSGPNPVVVAYPPTRTTLDLITGLEPRLLFYDCSENYESFPGIPQDIALTERELLRRADLISCTSPPLLEKVKPLRPDAFLNGPGVDYERFAVLQNHRSGEIRTVCFFGHLDDRRVDFGVLRAVADAGFRVRLVGGLGRVPRGFLGTPGVEHLGEVPHAKLPATLASVDAFVLPYKINGLTRSISPAKTYECLATGKPIMATPLPALAELGGHVYLARNAGEFLEVLRSLGKLETEEKARDRAALARENSWDARFQEFEAALWSRL